MTMQDTTPGASAPAPRRSNTLRTVLLVIGSILLAFILIGTAIQVAFSLNREDTSGTFTIEQEFDTVEVRTSAADVEVNYADIDASEIKFDQGSTNLRLDYNVSGGVLNVRVDRPGWGWWGWGFDGWGWNEGATLRLTLPASMESDAVDLKLNATAGNLAVSGDYGDVEVESTAGNLRMSGAAANMQLSTTAGNLELNGITVSGSFRSESTAGDSSFEFGSLPKSIDVQSTAGDVSVTMPRGSYRIETDTTAGEVRQNVSSDQRSDRVYRFETTAGNIDLNEG